MIKLVSAPLSLFSRKVEIALHEKGLGFERVMAPFTQAAGYSPKHPDVLAANPKGQVPVLLDGGHWLYDSTVIFEYLEDAYPVPPLYPASPAERARCRQFELFADEIMLVPLRALMHRTGPPPADAGRWAADEAKAKLAEAAPGQQFGDLSRQLAGKAYFCGAFSVADIAIFMAAHFSLRIGGPSLRENPALYDWHARLAVRPAFAATVAELRAADIELSTPVEGAYKDFG